MLICAVSCTTKTQEHSLGSSASPQLAQTSQASPATQATALSSLTNIRGVLPEVAHFGGSPLVADDQVRTVAYSPDGKFIASGGGAQNGSDLLVWDVATGARLYALSGANDSINDVVFSPDGHYLAASGLSTSIFIWDLQNRKVVHEIPYNGASTYDVAYAPDGQKLLTLDGNGRVIEWDLRQSKPTSRLIHGRRGLSTHIAMSGDGKQVVASADEGHFEIIPTNSKDRPKNIDGDALRIQSVAYSPDGKFILTGELSKDGKNRVVARDPRTGAQIRVFEGQSDLIGALKMSQDQRWIVSGSNGGHLVVWDANTGKVEFAARSRQESPIWSIAISPDGKRIVGAGRSRVVEVWDLQIGKALLDPSGHTAEITQIAYSRDGAVIASGDTEGVVIVRDANSGLEKARFPRMNFGIDTLVFSPDGRRLLTMAHGSARFWDTSTWTAVDRLERGRTDALRYTPDGSGLVASNETRIVRLLDAKTGEVKKAFGEAQPGDGMRQNLMTPSSVAFTSDGLKMAVARWDQPVNIWDLRTGTIEKSIDGTLFVTYAPDDRLMITGWGQVSKRALPLHLQIWDVATGKALREIEAEPPAVFSPSGDVFATLSEGEVQLWDPKSGERLARTASGEHKPLCFAFSSDGKRLATGGSDTTVRVFEVQR